MSLLNIALGGAVVYLLMKRSDGAVAPIPVLPEGVVSPPPVGVPGLSQPPPGGAGPVATPITGTGNPITDFILAGAVPLGSTGHPAISSAHCSRSERWVPPPSCPPGMMCTMEARLGTCMPGLSLLAEQALAEQDQYR